MVAPRLAPVRVARSARMRHPRELACRLLRMRRAPDPRRNHGAKFIFTPPGVIRVWSKKATIIAKGIPHCAAHEHGAVFEAAMFSTPGQDTAVGLFFRSYAYQIQFRRLNPWSWADPL
jgi:hypothetical protein